MNTKSYFCHNSIYDGSYPIPLSLSLLLSKIYRTQNEKQFCTGDQISSTLYYGVKKGCTVSGMLCRYLFISMKGKLMVYYIVFFVELLFFASEC